MFSPNKNQNGFTLIESIVALSIFSLLMVVVSSIFINANNLQKNIAAYQRLQNDGRFILEKLAREIRGRELVYPLITGNNNPIQTKIEFRPDEQGQAAVVEFVSPDLKYTLDGFTAENLNADDVAVEDAKFVIQPTAADTWGTQPSNNIQPRVVIWLKLKNRNLDPRFTQELVLQTTISSKLYQR